MKEQAQNKHSGRELLVAAARTIERMVAGVDLNHRPLGYGPEFLAGLDWFCTPFPHISRTLIDFRIEEIIAKLPPSCRPRTSRTRSRVVSKVALNMPAPTRTTSGWFVEITVVILFLLLSAIEFS